MVAVAVGVAEVDAVVGDIEKKMKKEREESEFCCGTSIWKRRK